VETKLVPHWNGWWRLNWYHTGMAGGD